jgi:hypothetical protein
MIDVDNLPTANSHPDVQQSENYSDDQLFDWQEISARCISPAPDHPAYGMSISEYIRKRSQFEHADDKKAQIHFRLFPDIAMGIPRLARYHKITPTRYINYILEHGLITFQHDYHDTYSLINLELDKMFDAIDSDKAFQVMAWSQKQTVSLKSASRDNKMFSPAVPEWMSDAIRSTAMELNAAQSDICYMCICIGIRTDSDEFRMPKSYLDKIEASISQFEFGLHMFYAQVQHLQTVRG